MSGNKDVFDTLNVCYKIQMASSFNLYQKINKIITNKELLFITSGGVPYLENACCNDENGNVYDYFIKNNSNNKIKNLNKNVEIASKILEKVTKLSTPKYFLAMLLQKILQQLQIIQLLKKLYIVRLLNIVNIIQG